MIFKVNPIKDLIPNDHLLKILTQLTEKELLEILEINNVNVYYRFYPSFLRETVY
jgi:hypothetical protein